MEDIGYTYFGRDGLLFIAEGDSRWREAKAEAMKPNTHFEEDEEEEEKK